MGYLYLFIAIIGEIIGTNFLNLSQGFTKPAPTIIALISYLITFYFLSLALTHHIPMNVAYAIWSGVGIVILTLISVLVLKQPINLASVIGILFIVIGVVLVNLFGTSH